VIDLDRWITDAERRAENLPFIRIPGTEDLSRWLLFRALEPGLRHDQLILQAGHDRFIELQILELRLRCFGEFGSMCKQRERRAGNANDRSNDLHGFNRFSSAARASLAGQSLDVAKSMRAA